MANEPKRDTAAAAAKTVSAASSAADGSAMPLWLGALTFLALLGTGMYGTYSGPAAMVAKAPEVKVETAAAPAVKAPDAKIDLSTAPEVDVPKMEAKVEAPAADAKAADTKTGTVAATTAAATAAAGAAVTAAETAVKDTATKVVAAAAAVAPPPGAPVPDVAMADLMAPGALKDNILGNADAPVTIVEYASTTCPHCRDFHRNVLPELKTKYIETGKAKLIFRAFTLNDLDLAVSMLARCTGEVRYYSFLGAMFDKQPEWAVNDGSALAKIREMSKQAGFTDETFQNCLKDEKLLKDLQDVKTKADTTFKVDSTPTIFVNGVKVNGNSLKDIEDVMKALGYS